MRAVLCLCALTAVTLHFPQPRRRPPTRLGSTDTDVDDFRQRLEAGAFFLDDGGTHDVIACDTRQAAQHAGEALKAAVLTGERRCVIDCRVDTFDSASRRFAAEEDRRAAYEAAAAAVAPELGPGGRAALDLAALGPAPGADDAGAEALLADATYSQPAVFCFEYALAKALLARASRRPAVVAEVARGVSVDMLLRSHTQGPNKQEARGLRARSMIQRLRRAAPRMSSSLRRRCAASPPSSSTS